ncbi:MAG TPA: nitrilase, partial [Chloroflexi bacterium]|nr:nitrilase [Chloroflexota bacterium]
MTASARKVRVAVVQAASVMFDREATVEKAVGLIAEAAAGGARLVVFPEALVPAYPRGLSFGSIVGNRSDEGRRIYARYLNNAVVIPSPATDRLGQAVREAGVWLAIGVIEREPAGGTLYCTLLYFGPDGAILGKHRKLKPTA